MREVVVLGKTQAHEDEIVGAVIVSELGFLDVIEWYRPRSRPN